MQAEPSKITSGCRDILNAGPGAMLLLVFATRLQGFRVAVKELKLSYYIGETLLFTIYIPFMVT